jgi:hypothetical protein
MLRYPYQIGPIGDSRKMATAPGGMLGIDRARILGDAMTAWPGYKRQTPTLARESVMGNPDSPNQLQVVRFPQDWTLRPSGHGIAVVDRESDSGSRVMAFGHMSAGRNGNALFSAACRTDEYEPLGAITTSGAYDGGDYAVWDVETTSSTHFKWRKDGGAYTTGVAISTTAAQLGADGPFIAWATTAGHAAGEVYAITAGDGSAHLAAEMIRVGASDFPWIVVGDKATLIGNQFNVPLADDGNNVRKAGIPVPFLPPTVRTVDVAGATALFENVCDVDTDWTPAASCSIAETSGDLANVHAEGTGSLRLTINEAASDASAVFSYALAAPVNLAVGTRDRFRVWLRGLWAPERVILGEGIFFKITGGTGADVEVSIPPGYAINGQQWQYIDCAVDVTEAKTGATTFEVWISKQHIDADLFNLNGVGDFVFNIDAFEYMEGANVETADTLESNQVWWFKSSWVEDTKSGAPGPSSQPIELANHAVQIDVAGAPFYYDVASALDDEQRSVLNTAPPEATGFMIWVSNEGYARSERFTIGPVQVPEFYRFSRNPEFDLDFLTAGSNGQLTFDVSSQQIAAALGTVDNASNNPTFPFYNYPPPPAKCAAADGNVIVFGGGTDYSVGEWLFTDLYQVIFPVAAAPEDTPIVSEALVGRTVRIEGEEKTYTVGKALDTDGDGVLDALWVFTQRTDSMTQIPIGAYSGTTEGKKATFVAEKRTLRWTNVTQDSGIDMTTASPLNELVNVFPENDEIKALFKVGEFLYALGANTMMVMRANDGAFSDSVITTGLRYSNPTVTAGVGIAGPRAWASMTDGRIVWVGPRGEIFIASPSGGYERHPASANLAGIMGGDGELLYTEMMEFVFAAVYREGGEDYLYIGLPSQLDDPSAAEQIADTTYGGVGLGVQNYAIQNEAYNTLDVDIIPYNWPPTDDQLADGEPENAFWGPILDDDLTGITLPMHMIHGLAFCALDPVATIWDWPGGITAVQREFVEWVPQVGGPFESETAVIAMNAASMIGNVSGVSLPGFLQPDSTIFSPGAPYYAWANSWSSSVPELLSIPSPPRVHMWPRSGDPSTYAENDALTYDAKGLQCRRTGSSPSGSCFVNAPNNSAGQQYSYRVRVDPVDDTKFLVYRGTTPWSATELLSSDNPMSDLTPIEIDDGVWIAFDYLGNPSINAGTNFWFRANARNLPTTRPEAYTDLESFWDSKTPVLLQDGTLDAAIVAVDPDHSPLDNYNGVNVIDSWGANDGAPPVAETIVDADVVSPANVAIGFTIQLTVDDDDVLVADPTMYRAYWAAAPPADTFLTRATFTEGQNDGIRVIDENASAIRFRCWVEGQVGQAIPAGTFSLIFRNGPQDVNEIEPASDASDREVEIPELICGEWNSVVMDPPATNGTWTDRDDVSRGGCLFNRLLIRRNLPISEEAWFERGGAFVGEVAPYLLGVPLTADAGGYSLSLFFANGHQVIANETVYRPIPLVIPSCIPYGSVQVQTPTDAPYRFGVLVNLTTGMAFTGAECQFTCAESTSAVGCAIPGMAPIPLMMGDENGYLSIMDQAVLSWGSPSSAFVFLATSGTDDTATLDVSAYSPNPLTVDEDGNPTLNGLIACKIGVTPAVGPPTREQRRITANTTNGITVAVDWTYPVVAGDTIIIGPLFALMKFEETRCTSRSGVAMLGFTCDVEQKPGEFEAEFATFDPNFQIFTFRPDGRSMQCAPEPYRTQRFTLANLEAAEFAWFPRTQGVSFAWQIMMLGDARGRLLLRNPTLGGIEMSGAQRR